MSIEIQGHKELIAKLQALKRTEAKAAIRKGSRAGCKVIADKAKDLVPERSGTLARQIKVRAIKSRKTVGTQVIVQADGADFYGAFIEYGLTHKKLEGQHFLKQAADDAGDEALRVMAATIDAYIQARMKQ